MSGVSVDPLAPVSALITGELNRDNAREEQKRQHRYNKEMMGLSYMYGQAEQKNSALNTKEGYKDAGLSPALAAAGSFAPASGPSPLTSTPSPNRYPDMNSGIAAMFQLQNMKAQTDNLNADTKSKEIKNEQEQDANAVSSYLSDIYFAKMAESAHSEEEQNKYKELASIAKNKGSYGLLMNFVDTLDKKELYDAHYQEYLVKEYVAYHQALDDDTIKALAKMPTKQYAQLDELAKLYVAEAKKLAADKNLSDEERNLRIAQTKLTNEQIENIKEVTKNLQNTNVMKMLDEGRYGDAIIATILLLLGNVSASASKKF